MLARDLIEKLPIVSEDVLSEAARQPQLFLAAAEYRIAKMRGRAQASAALEQHRARIGLRVRAKKDAEGKKPTEGTVAARVELEPDTKILRRAHDEAHEKEELAKLILEAMRMRRDSIRIIADHQLYNSTKEGYEVERIEENRKLRNRARTLEQKRQHTRGVEDDE